MTDEEIEQRIEWCHRDWQSPWNRATGDMLLALKARAEAAEQRVVELVESRNEILDRRDAFFKRVKKLEDEIEQMKYEYRNTEPL